MANIGINWRKLLHLIGLATLREVAEAKAQAHDNLAELKRLCCQAYPGYTLALAKFLVDNRIATDSEKDLIGHRPS